jgi:hypothetical protein
MMSAAGQSRRFGGAAAISGLPQTAEVERSASAAFNAPGHYGVRVAPAASLRSHRSRTIDGQVVCISDNRCCPILAQTGVSALPCRATSIWDMRNRPSPRWYRRPCLQQIRPETLRIIDIAQVQALSTLHNDWMGRLSARLLALL